VIKKVRYNFSDSDDEIKPLNEMLANSAVNKTELRSLLLKIQPKAQSFKPSDSPGVVKLKQLKIKPALSTSIKLPAEKVEQEINLAETIEIRKGKDVINVN
jgi:hypothetical protein